MKTAIGNAERIVLIAHVNPDADSMGSACAMYAHLLRLRKKVTLFCASETIDSRLGFIPWSEKATARWDERADLAIAFDCGSYARLGVEPHCPLVNVDHHAGNEGYGDIVLVDPDAVSTTAVLYRWFSAEGIRLNPKMATALYAGLADDTDGFRSGRCDAAVFETAAALIRAGADSRSAAHALFVRRPLSALRLKGKMFETLELLCDGRLAVLEATRRMFEATGADAAACDDALNEAMGLPTVRAGVLLRERSDGSVKVSLRGTDGTDVGKIAASFGGGGHRFASGFTVTGEALSPVREAVVSILQKELT